MTRFDDYTDREIDRLVADRLGYRAVIGASFWPHITDHVIKIITPDCQSVVECAIGCDIWGPFFDIVQGWTQSNYNAKQLLPLIKDYDSRVDVAGATPRKISIAYLMDGE